MELEKNTNNELAVKVSIEFPDNSTMKIKVPPELPGVEYQNHIINLQIPLNGLITENYALFYVGVYCLKNCGFNKKIVNQFLGADDEEEKGLMGDNAG